MRPKNTVDLALAPVAAEIDLNLQHLRDEPHDAIVYRVELGLNSEPGATRDERAEQVRELAVSGVELHGWTVTVSDDASRLHLQGGSVSLDLGLSPGLQEYIDAGTA